MSNCNCGSIQQIGDGGLKFGGAGTVLFDINSQGGLLFGGKGTVTTNDIYDSYLLALPLIELESPYIDLSSQHRNAASIGIPTNPSDGVFCSISQEFLITNGVGSLLQLPPDNTATTYSFSAWILIEGNFKQKTIYSSGNNFNGFDCVFSVETSYINHLVATIKTDTESVAVYSATVLETDRWYHIAVTYDKSALTLFINGIKNNTVAVTGLPLPASNNCYVGSKDKASFWTGNLQEIRITSEVKDSDWFTAERKNFCGQLVSMGGEQTVTEI